MAEDRVKQLAEFMQEFVDESDWTVAENGGHCDVAHMKKHNKFVTGMRKKSSTSKGAVHIDGVRFGWNYMRSGAGGNEMRDEPYIASGQLNLIYSRKAEEKVFRVELYLENTPRKTFYSAKIGTGKPTPAQVYEAVQAFWAQIDAQPDYADIENRSHDNKDVRTQKADPKLLPYIQMLKSAYNVIFRGAPGTGKTYLAKQIAAQMVSGTTSDFDALSNQQKSHIGFVQFHPSYDYADFVEGMRPVSNNEADMTFDIVPGTFKQFIQRAKDSKNTRTMFDTAWDKLLASIAQNGYATIPLKRGEVFGVEANPSGNGGLMTAYDGGLRCG